MRRLVNFKLWAVIALLLGGMSSCLDSEDPINMYVQYAYMLQNDNGTYTPQVRVIGNDIQSASLNINDKRFNFRGINEYIWEIPESGIYTSTIDSVPFGYFPVVVTNKSGDSKRLTVSFYNSSKKIGDILVNKLEYDSETKKMSVALESAVQNGSFYYLMAKMPVVSSTGMTTGQSMWLPCARVELNETNKYSNTVDLSAMAAGTYPIAIGVAYETTFRISESIVIEIKKEANTETEK